MFCNRERVENFFLRFSELFERDPRLIWNADETQLNAAKRFKVICERNQLPLVTVLENVPHLTGMVTISGGGVVLEPLIILKNLQNLRDLADYETDCYFATSTNGWMTKDLWVYYALLFCTQISQYRLRLPEELREATMLLIVDGHKSRISVLAAVIFVLNNIDVLVLPPHTSHLLQMYDVGVAPALKVAFKNELEKRVQKLAGAPPGEKLQQMRIALVESFLDALRRGATNGNIKSGFRMSGVAPLDPMKAIDSQFTIEAPMPGI
jgi:hypothetical protein